MGTQWRRIGAVAQQASGAAVAQQWRSSGAAVAQQWSRPVAQQRRSSGARRRRRAFLGLEADEQRRAGFVCFVAASEFIVAAF